MAFGHWRYLLTAGSGYFHASSVDFSQQDL